MYPTENRGSKDLVASATVLSRQSPAALASGRLSSGSPGERYEREPWWEGTFREHRVAVSGQQSLGGLAKRRDHLGVRFPHLLEDPLRRRGEERLRRSLHPPRTLVPTGTNHEIFLISL